MAGVTNISSLFFGVLIVGLLQAPGYCIQGQQRQDHPDIVAKYINCYPETTVESCPQNGVYRSINGACNNRERPNLGVSDTAYARWLPAEYEDGVSLPMGWTEGKLCNGHLLPLVREVSNKIVATPANAERVDEERSQMFMEWGQWITHDMSFSPIGMLDCIKKSTCGSECIKNKPENCFPIEIPPNDPTAAVRGKCIVMMRIIPVCNGESEMREPLNMATSFIDAGSVYGNQECMANMLKNTTSHQGLLAINQRCTDNSRALMPFDDELVDHCPASIFCIRKDPCPASNTTHNIPCFAAGDKRANQNLPYLTINTLFFREHNRLAKELKKINPHWDGEKIFLEARKIMGAMMQIITYRDYLPLVLGEYTDIEFPPYKRYIEEVDPRTSVVFNVAFRWAHTSIPPFIFRLDEKYKPFHPDSKIPFHQSMFATWRIAKEGGIDPVLRGLLVNGAKLMEQNAMVSDEVREKLFKSPTNNGFDLASVDLQRGRDYGLPMYNSWRRFCGLTAPRDLTELTAVFKNEDLARKLLDLYKTPENIDMWIGGISEPFVKGGRVGPLIACLTGSQFRKLRDGDRFWWQNPGVFTQQQVASLSRISFLRIICDNSGLTEVPRDVFKSNEYPEDFVSCDTINKLDLAAWIEGQAKKGKKHTEL